MKFKIIITVMIALLILLHILIAGNWHTYRPSEGIECIVFHDRNGNDVDCYKVEGGKHDRTIKP